ncbi:MAG: hypothetical protein HUJ76_12775, partial [Parasporobacterium sp.]|nr:hypothetical protein [Parasporobacterium sp.]
GEEGYSYKQLTKGTDYTVDKVEKNVGESWNPDWQTVDPFDNTVVGSYRLTITGINGYTGTVTTSDFSIYNQYNFGLGEVTAVPENEQQARYMIGNDPVFRFIDNKGKPYPLVEGTDYKVTNYKKNYVEVGSFDNKVAAEYSFYVEGLGKWFGGEGKWVDFTIYDPNSFSELYLEMQKNPVVSGNKYVIGYWDESRTKFTALKEGTDYTKGDLKNGAGKPVSEYNEPGSYSVEVTGMGTYSGEATVNFEVIDASKANDLDVLGVTVKEKYIKKGTDPVVGYWTGSVWTTLKKGVDYTYTTENFDNNTVGEFENFSIKGNGKYTGSTTLDFTICEANDMNLCKLAIENKKLVVRNSDGKVLTNKTDYTYTVLKNAVPYDGDTFDAEYVVYNFTVTGVEPNYTGSKQQMIEYHDYEMVVLKQATFTEAGVKMGVCKV